MNGELHGDQPESTDTGVPKRAVREIHEGTPPKPTPFRRRGMRYKIKKY